MATKTASRNTKHATLTRTLTELAQTMTPGDRFPSQSELMRRFQVSDRTVLRSLEDLRRAGWIVRRHGSGTFVTDPQERRDVPVPGASGSPRAASAPAASPVIAALALTFSPSRFYYQHCLDSLSGRAESADLSLVCHHARHANAYEDALPLEALRPRGFVVFNYTLAPIAQQLQERGHRVVIAGTPTVDVYPTVPCVYGDHELGGYLATQHLLELGHRRIAYLRDTPRGSFTRSLRWHGHQRALRDAEKAGETIHAELLERDVLAPWRKDPALAAAYFARPGAPTGLVVWNDSEATALLRLLGGIGIRVPDDVSVVGYDALPESEDSLPPLTTVNQHVDRQMHAVMDLLTRPVAPPPTQSVVVLPTLVRRASCAPPKHFASS